MTYTHIDALPQPPQEWLDAIAEEESKEQIPKECCGARPWEGDICTCKQITKQTKCGHCGEIGHSKTTCPQRVDNTKKTTSWNRANKMKSYRKYRCTSCGMFGGSLYNKSNLDRHQRNNGCIKIV